MSVNVEVRREENAGVGAEENAKRKWIHTEYGKSIDYENDLKDDKRSIYYTVEVYKNGARFLSTGAVSTEDEAVKKAVEWDTKLNDCSVFISKCITGNVIARFAI